METEKKRNTWSLTGCLIAFLALVAAFLSPQIAEAIDPPPVPLEETVVDFAARLKNAAMAKAKGEDYQPPVVENEAQPSAALVPLVIGVGLLGTGLGLGGLIRGERTSLSAAAMGLGISAAMVQWSIIFAGALLLILLVVSVLGTLGIEL